MTAWGGYWLTSFVYAPVYSFTSGYRGFEVAHNDSIRPMNMIVDVEVNNPSELWFYYSFLYDLNGTYSFFFAFPFNIVGRYPGSDVMPWNSTPYCSAVWLQYVDNNVSYFWKDHEIFGDFMIENTFQEGTKGSYTFVLPFGMGAPFDVTRDLIQSLKVLPYSDVNVTLYVALPAGSTPTTTFPPNRGLEFPPPPSNLTQARASIAWDAGTLQNTVTIEAVNTSEKSFYDSAPFYSGVLLAVGLQFMFTTGYDSIRKWARPSNEV